MSRRCRDDVLWTVCVDIVSTSLRVIIESYRRESSTSSINHLAIVSISSLHRLDIVKSVSTSSRHHSSDIVESYQTPFTSQRKTFQSTIHKFSILVTTSQQRLDITSTSSLHRPNIVSISSRHSLDIISTYSLHRWGRRESQKRRECRDIISCQDIVISTSFLHRRECRGHRDREERWEHLYIFSTWSRNHLDIVPTECQEFQECRDIVLCQDIVISTSSLHQRETSSCVETVSRVIENHRQEPSSGVIDIVSPSTSS